MRKKRGRKNGLSFRKNALFRNKEIIWGITSATFRTIMSMSKRFAPFAQIWSEYNNLSTLVTVKKANEFASALKIQFDKHETEIMLWKEKTEKSLEDMSRRVAVQDRIIDCLTKEFEIPKVQLLAQITVNCIINDDLTREKKIRAIDSFRQITMNDLDVLMRFSQTNILQVREITGISLEEAIPSLCKLSSIGLITEMMYTSYGEWTSSVESEWVRSWRDKRFELLPSGKELLAMISE